MKTAALLIFILTLTTLSFSQTDIPENERASDFSLGLSLGTSFKESTTAGFASNLSLNYSLSKYFDIAASLGYFTLFEDPKEGGHPKGGRLENNEIIMKKFYDLEQRKLKFMPLELRGRFNLNKGGINPYVSLNIGANIIRDFSDPYVHYLNYNETTGQIYESKIVKRSEVNGIFDDVMNIGLCVGINYPINKQFGLDLSYIVQDSNSIGKNNNILAGIIYNL